MAYFPAPEDGQAPMSDSLPVVIASDQTPIPVTGTVVVTGGGDASAANQTTEIAQLTAILNKIIVAPATESTVAAIETTLSSIPFATQTTLAAILAKIIAAPATEAKQDTANTHLSSIDTKLTSPIAVTGTVVVDETNLATSAKQDTGNTSLATIAGKDFATQTSLAALISANHTDLAAILAKLISNPASTTLQTAGNISLSSIDGKTPALGQALAAASIPVVLTAAQVTALTPPTSVGVNNFPATQPVSAVSLPLPSGAATSANQSTGNTSLASIDSKLTNPLPISGTVTVIGGGDASAANQVTEISHLSSIDTKLSNPLPVSQASQPLPTGASTEATLALIKAKTDNIDVALSTRTKPADQQHVIVDSSALPTNAAQDGTDATGVVQLTGGGGIRGWLSGIFSKISTLVSSGIGRTWTLSNGTDSVNVGNFPATQPVSATSLPLPTGAATSALQTQPGVDIGDVTINNTGGGAAVNIQDGGNSITVDGTVAISGSVATTGGLTDTQLRATPVPISGTVAVTGAGDATAANQTTEITALGTLNTSVNTLLKPANTLAAVTSITNVVHVDDNAGSLTVDGVITANAGTNLNTSLLALETGGNLAAIKADLDSIDAGIPTALGQTTMANSMPVTIASNQSPIAVTGSFGGTDNTQLYSGTISATGVLSGIDTTGYSNIVIQFSGTWQGNIIFEGSHDNATDWQPLLTTDLDTLFISDVISNNGFIGIKPSAKYIRINVLQLGSGSITALVLGRISLGTNASDVLALAMDKSNNSPLYTEDISGGVLRDTNRATIPSDAPQLLTAFLDSTTSVSSWFDTTGYQSVSVQFQGIFNSNAVLQTSQDKVSIFQTSVYQTNIVSVPTYTTTMTGASNSIWIFPVTSRYFRIAASTFTSGVIQLVMYLRQIPFSPLVPTNNLAFINGSPINVANATGVLAVGGNAVANTAVGVTSPIQNSGVDSNNIVRRILTDISGRTQTNLNGLDQTGVISRGINTLSPNTTALNITSIPVQDVAQYEGQTQIELLGQLLKEMKIMNLYLSQGFDLDEPNSIRGDFENSLAN